MEPTEKDLASQEFEAIWRTIKNWDIGKFYLEKRSGDLISKEGMRYSGATGNDAMEILNAIRHLLPKKPSPKKRTRIFK